jgi:hypothetical protein
MPLNPWHFGIEHGPFNIGISRWQAWRLPTGHCQLAELAVKDGRPSHTSRENSFAAEIRWSSPLYQ